MKHATLWGALLLLGAVSRCELPTVGTTGEVGQGEFRYSCAGRADPYCDGDLDIPWANPPDPSSCFNCGWPHAHRTIPTAIAVGATFDVHFAPSSDIQNVFLLGASPYQLTNDQERFTAIAPRDVAILAFHGNDVLDFVHVMILEPERIRIDRVDLESPVDLDGLSLAPGEHAWLRAITMAGTKALSGQLPCAWEAQDATAVHLDSPMDDNVIQVVADATGVAQVHLQLGNVERWLPVSVGDATPAGEVQP